MRVVNWSYLRIKHSDGHILMSVADRGAKENIHPLQGVLLLGAVADDEATRKQRLQVHRVVHHRCKRKNISPTVDGEMGELGDYCEGTQDSGEGKESGREGSLRPSDSKPDGRVASGIERDLQR
jgi:hypothetical protein